LNAKVRFGSHTRGDSLMSEEGSELDIEPRHFNAGEVPKADFHSA
jgi:hypothetical protein